MKYKQSIIFMLLSALSFSESYKKKESFIFKVFVWLPWSSIVFLCHKGYESCKFKCTAKNITLFCPYNISYIS